MNRLHIRLGTWVKEHIIELPHDWDMPVLEGVILRALPTYYHILGIGLEYIGCYEWDVVHDGFKIGHVKAWEEPTERLSSDSPCLWSIVILSFFAYLALC